MELRRRVISSTILLIVVFTGRAPAAAPKANYDESKVPKYTLPDPLARISHNTIEKSSLFWYKSLIEKNLNQKQGANHENTL